ncbi:MBL fold metallo-hydrolase [Heliophilum fasciatum]|uniref:Glyoxylase-like metal-dependent hydrolase (Beta-lactamase superfamily II) n=1 Tax=Heliophilum fasciatum TaxID=35700 RepID=A0A4R2RGF6_9FIRM|nr:MBL fold metallo-hydrolase [Heliophilum fasciatum]MCW2279082.1 glyoxylase-like metal-dependent hydrolase (beta-lactamase superfamily II) [Heliophilum fasciatum]TCP61479.1 glyoxylase-like metal-dependent hydrolase (beta-lactamase superfamily II) [Heliophilum fasciatum]
MKKKVTPQVIPIILPTPYQVGDVVIYLIVDEQVVLIDTGPPTEEALAALRRQLQDQGLQLSDLDAVLVTHHHPDHLGLAPVIAQETGLKIGLHPLELYSQHQETGEPYHIFPDWGLPPGFAQKMEKQFRAMTRMKEPLDPSMVASLTDRQVIDTGTYQIAVRHFPGHTMGHVLFYEPAEKWLISGDFLLEKFMPNPMSFQMGDQRIATLPLYFESLRCLSKMDITTVFPGHGRAFPYSRTFIGNILEHYRKRSIEILQILQIIDKGTTFEVAQRLYPRGFEREAFLVLSKVLGCLDLLERQGIVVKDHDWAYHIDPEADAVFMADFLPMIP